MDKHISHDLAEKLKLINFDLETHAYIYIGDTGTNSNHIELNKKPKNWNSDSLCISLPTYEEVYEWFVNKYNWESFIKVINIDNEYIYCGNFYVVNNGEIIEDYFYTGIYLNKIDAHNRLVSDMIGIVEEINTIRKETGQSFEICLNRWLYHLNDVDSAIESIKSGIGIDKTNRSNHKFL